MRKRTQKKKKHFGGVNPLDTPVILPKRDLSNNGSVSANIDDIDFDLTNPMTLQDIKNFKETRKNRKPFNQDSSPLIQQRVNVLPDRKQSDLPPQPPSGISSSVDDTPPPMSDIKQGLAGLFGPKKTPPPALRNGDTPPPMSDIKQGLAGLLGQRKPPSALSNEDIPPPKSDIKEGLAGLLGQRKPLLPPEPVIETPTPPVEDKIEIWPPSADFPQDLVPIYNKFYLIQRGKEPYKITLSKKIKDEIKSTFNSYTDAEVNNAATKISKQLTQSINDALESESKTAVLDEKIINELQILYDDRKAKNPVSNPDEIESLKQKLKKFTDTHLNDKLNITNKYLQARYFGKIRQEDEIIDFKEEKFKNLYEIISCNPVCLRSHIDKLAMGMEEKAKRESIDLQKVIEKEENNFEKITGEEERKNKRDEINFLKKSLGDAKKTVFTLKEIKNFESEYNNGNIAKLFPEIESQCGAKKKSSSSTSNSSSSGNSSGDTSVDGNTCTPLIKKDKTKDPELDYSGMYDLLRCLIYSINTEETPEIRDAFIERKNSLIELMPFKFKTEKAKEIKDLNKILQTKPTTVLEQMEQESAKKSIKEINNSLENFSVSKNIEEINKTVQRIISDEKKNNDKTLAETLRKEGIKQRSEGIKNYKKGFIERNPSNGEAYLDSLNKLAKKNEILSNFSNAFPEEDKFEFWNKIVGMSFDNWTKSIESKAAASAAPPARVGNVSKLQPVNVNLKMSSTPTPDEIELNKKLFNFELNENGQFIKDGKIVNVLGEAPLSQGGGYRKSNKKGHVSNKKSKRKRTKN